MNMYNSNHKTHNKLSREGWERTFGKNKCKLNYVYGQDFNKFHECITKCSDEEYMKCIDIKHEKH